MSKVFVATATIKILGQIYQEGDPVDHESVDGERLGRLISKGRVTIVDADETAINTITNRAELTSGRGDATVPPAKELEPKEPATKEPEPKEPEPKEPQAKEGAEKPTGKAAAKDTSDKK